MFKKIILTFLFFALIPAFNNITYAEEPDYTTLRVVDLGTFNEYRYRITDEFFNLRSKYELEWSVDVKSAAKILDIAKKGYNYLPDSLSNKNYYNHLKTSIERGIKYPNNISNYTSIVTSIENFLDKTSIPSIKWTVEAFPKTWNAPLTVTLRWNVVDETGTKIPSYNYTWWMHIDGKRKELGDNISLTHVFKEEWNFSVFLDVKSAHKNAKGYVDVLPFSSRADIVIKEKVASVIIKVNSYTLRNDNELKFTPDEARYWLLFDATSSTPTSWSKFVKTTWDFWNGIIKEYTWNPKVERIVYAKEWEFTVKLKLQTNELKQIERKFVINIHDPIATIKTSKNEWYLQDKFTFSAQNTVSNKDLSYAWEIIDLKQDKVIFRKAWNLFTYSFSEKGKYNVKMKVTEPSGETDVDSKIIYINSRAPTADFTTTIPFNNKPNKVFFDATKSFDPDFSDDGKLIYSWIINGNRVDLEDPNYNGSTWYFNFESIWDHSVVLEVRDPDSISSQKKEKVSIKSILSVDFFAFPRVAQRNTTIRFVSESPEARFYEWDFWDGNTKWWKDENISHKFAKSGIYKVKLKVIDINDNINTFSKNVYIWESSSPYSFIELTDSAKNNIPYDVNACWKIGAYTINRVDSVVFSWKESIDITWKNTWLTYSWKVWNESYKNSADFSKKFDELGCFPVKLTVKSDSNGKTHSTTIYVEVKNLKPTLSSVDVNVLDTETDPVIVNVSALWAKDRDGVIQSFLWYYYTDIDSEPQDFRATKSPSTSFVLPKVTWNYYFVVVMKDNNEERITSEEITGSKYFMTLSWDNLNTPLVKLNVNNSSVGIWEEVIFDSSVENILGQDLSEKVKYSWDFDGDGFYDKETTTWVVSHKYLSSGDKYAKVKVKYKGFSNTKTLTISVANVLKPQFGFISIWNKFVFFDKTLWKADSYEWDLWDWTIIKNKQFFTHIYTDKKSAHLVNLKVSEWTKVKNIEQRVVKNVKNIILSRKEWLITFTNPSIKDDKIILKNAGDNAFIYLWASNPDIVNYSIDYNLDYDSDLNGWNDDDEDNIKDSSYTSWEAIKVELNEKKYQKVRVFIKNSLWEVVDSRDITIVKEYVLEKSIDLNTLVFDGVSNNTKLKIEKLKSYVWKLPKEHKLKGLMYVQKLQEEWSDNRWKTNVILEFEGFIYDINVDNGDDIINLLESLLVEDQEDKSEKAIAFNALKNLIPVSIVCENKETLVSENCYEEMILKLEAIRDNPNIDENKILWTSILKVIAVDELMTTKQKTDFKAILKTFIYGGIENIPVVEKKEIINNNKSESSSNFMWLLTDIIIWIFVIIGWFIFIVLWYYIYYLVVNKNDNIWFQDFIIEKTSWEKKAKQNSEKTLEEDILSELWIDEKELEKSEKKEEIQAEKSQSWITSFSKEKENKEKVSFENKEKKVDPIFGNPKKEPKIETKSFSAIKEEKKDISELKSETKKRRCSRLVKVKFFWRYFWKKRRNTDRETSILNYFF